MCWLSKEANLLQSQTLRPMQALYTTTHSNARQPPSARWWRQTKISKSAQQCQIVILASPPSRRQLAKKTYLFRAIRRCPPAVSLLFLHSPFFDGVECFFWVGRRPTALCSFWKIFTTLRCEFSICVQNVFGVCRNPGLQLSTIVVTEIPSFVSSACMYGVFGKN